MQPSKSHRKTRSDCQLAADGWQEERRASCPKAATTEGCRLCRALDCRRPTLHMAGAEKGAGGAGGVNKRAKQRRDAQTATRQTLLPQLLCQQRPKVTSQLNGTGGVVSPSAAAWSKCCSKSAFSRLIPYLTCI